MSELAGNRDKATNQAWDTSSRLVEDVKLEKKGLEGLTVKEAEERKAELAKIRALQSYQEAKYRRQGKIKSKKFRKIARKEKEKEKVQELERLQATDPEAAKEKLEEMEKVKTTS